MFVSHGFAASVVTVSEKPNAFTSSLSGVSLYDFNALSTGVNKNVEWQGVGTFDQLNILRADQYGGAPSATQAKGTNYSVQGVGSSVKTTTLSLNKPSSYFGFYWSAGDGANQLQFYNGNNLVGQFTTQSLLTNLPNEFYGNPLNRAQNKGEPYAFVNFYGDINTSWDTVVLSNVTSSGFESDNYTSRIEAWNSARDGVITGIPISVVEGASSSKISKIPDSFTYASRVPAAPAPPLIPLLIFAGLLLLRSSKLV